MSREFDRLILAGCALVGIGVCMTVWDSVQRVTPKTHGFFIRNVVPIDPTFAVPLPPTDPASSR